MKAERCDRPGVVCCSDFGLVPDLACSRLPAGKGMVVLYGLRLRLSHDAQPGHPNSVHGLDTQPPFAQRK